MKVIKYLGKSTKYKHVYIYQTRSGKSYKGMLYGARYNQTFGKYFKTEREAALYIDKQLIERNKEPVNILIRDERNKGPTKQM